MRANTYMTIGAAPLPLAALLLALAGCGPDTRKMLDEHRLPQADESWSKRVVASEPELREKKVLKLDRAIEIALKYHPDGVASKSVAEAASARIGQALAAYLPKLNATGSWTRSTSNSWVDRDAASPGADRAVSGHASGLGKFSQGSDKSSEGRSIGASGSLLVLDAGGAVAGIQAADREAQAAALDWEVTRQGLAFAVRQAYFTVLQNEALLKVAEESLASFQSHLEEARKLHEVGRRTRFDVTKAEVDLSNAQVERIRAKNALDTSRAQLNRALGLEEDPGYGLDEDIPLERFGIGFEDAAAQARKSRPELPAARSRFEASQATVRKVWSDYFPKLSLTGSYTLSGPQFPLVRNWSAGPSLDWNLFNGFQTTRQVEEALANVRQARAALASAEQKVFLEVYQASSNLKEASERLNLADQTVKSAEESKTLAEARYRAGQGTLLEQTDAQVALTRAQAERIKARADYEIGVANQLKAMGLLEKPKEPGK